MTLFAAPNLKRSAVIASGRGIRQCTQPSQRLRRLERSTRASGGDTNRASYFESTKESSHVSSTGAADHLRFLADAGVVLAATLDEEQVITQIVRLATSYVADWCAVYRADEQGKLTYARGAYANPAEEARVNALWQRAFASVSAPELTTSEAACALWQALYARTVTLVAYGTQVPIVAGNHQPYRTALHLVLARMGLREVLCVPLLAPDASALGGRLLGTLVLARTAPTGHFVRADLTLSQAYGSQAALALSRARAVSTMRNASRQREQRLAGLIHDLKTPLTVIHLHTQYLKRHYIHNRDRDDSEAGALASASQSDDLRADTLMSERLTHLEAAVARMVLLLDDVVDATRIEAGRELTLQRQPIDLIELAKAAIATHQALTSRHRVHLLQSDAAMIGNWDPRRLERVLDNLLANAVKYSPNGGNITVEVLREGSHNTRSWAVLQVRDEGIGIPESDLLTIFEPFRRSANVAERIPGTGLGLANVRQIVE